MNVRRRSASNQPFPVVQLLAGSAANEARIHTSCAEGQKHLMVETGLILISKCRE